MYSHVISSLQIECKRHKFMILWMINDISATATLHLYDHPNNIHSPSNPSQTPSRISKILENTHDEAECR